MNSLGDEFPEFGDLICTKATRDADEVKKVFVVVGSATPTALEKAVLSLGETAKIMPHDLVNKLDASIILVVAVHLQHILPLAPPPASMSSYAIPAPGHHHVYVHVHT